MPTNFETFEDDDVIFARHVKQLFPSIQELESGFALYRVASSAPEGYSVDFSSAANSDGHSLDSLTPGQTIIFKANYTNLAGQNLKVLLNNSQSVVHPLYMGNTPIGADAININQIVMVVYNNADPAPNAAPARFQVIGVSSGSGGGIATPVSVANGGTGADNEGQARINLEVPSNAELAAGLAGKANTTHSHAATAIGSGNVSDTEFGYLDGVTSPIQTQLNNKQSQSGLLDDIASLTLTKGDILVHDGVDIAKLDAGTNGQVLSADSAEATGLKWVAQSGGGGGATNLNDLNDVELTSPANAQILQHNGSGQFVNRSLAAAGISEIGHTHPFTAITGTVPVAQGGTGSTTAAAARTALGTNDAVNITAGTLPVARGGTGGTSQATAQTALGVPSNATLTSGLAAKQNVSEKGAANGYASLDATGKVPAAQLPAGGGGASNLDDLTDVAITSPTEGQVLRRNATEFVNTNLATSDVTGLDAALAGKASTAHTHAAADITSGTLPVARGGTGASLTTTGGAGQVLKQTSVGGVVSVSALAASDMPAAIDATKIGTGAVSNAEFGYLDGVTSAIQTQINGKANTAHTHAAADITSGTLPIARGGTGASLTATGGAGQVLKQTTVGGVVSVSALAASDMPAAIDATKIGTGTVSNTEFGYLDGVTSAIQTQINGKANTAHSHAAADITSGTLPVARGGTGGTSQATAQTALDVPSNATLTSGLAAKQSTSEKGVANGYAGLDATGKVPAAQLPASGSSNQAVQAYTRISAASQNIGTTSWTNITGCSGTFSSNGTASVIVVQVHHQIGAVSAQPNNLGHWRVELTKSGSTTQQLPGVNGLRVVSPSALGDLSSIGGTFRITGLAAGTWTLNLQMRADSGNAFNAQTDKSSGTCTVLVLG